MLARTSSTVSCGLARSTVNLQSVTVAARSNSSLASHTTASSADSQSGVVPPRKRTIPKADIFGDIEITNVVKLGSDPKNTGVNNSSKPDLSWLGLDEFGGSLARRLAGAKAQSSPEAGTKAFPAPQADLSTENVSTERKKANTRQPGRDRERRSDAQTGERRSDAQTGERRWSGAQTGERRSGVQTGERRSGVQTGERRSVNANTSQDRHTAPLARVKRTEEQELVKMAAKQSEDVQPAKKREPSSPRAPVGSMQIYTTDLDKLFGAPEVSMSSSSPQKSTLPAPRGRGRATSVSSSMAIRVQRTLEYSGGDYSRYLPDIQGLNEPEKRTPLGIAQLAMARRTDAGLRMRRNALGIVQKLVVSETTAGASP